MDDDNFAATQRANKAATLSARYHICVLLLCVLLAAAAAAAGIYTLIRDTPLPGALLLVLAGVLVGVAVLGTVRHRGAARLYAATAVLVGLACAAGAAASVVGAVLAAGDGEGGAGVGFFAGVAVGLAAVAVGLWVDVCVVGGRRAVAMAGGSTAWREDDAIATTTITTAR